MGLHGNFKRDFKEFKEEFKGEESEPCLVRTEASYYYVNVQIVLPLLAIKKSVVHQNFSCFIVFLADKLLSFADRATFV